MFIVTTVQQLKQLVIKTQNSEEFQKSLTTDNPALVHSVHLAHSPIHSLLNSVVYWFSQQSTHLLIHYATHRAVPPSAVNICCPLHSTLCRQHSLSATHKTLPSTLAVRYTQNSAVNTRCPLDTTLCRQHSLSATLNTLPSTLAVRYTQHSAVNTRWPLHTTLCRQHSLSATHNTLPSTLSVRYTQHSAVNTRCPLHSTLCRQHSLSATHNTLPSTLAVRYTQHCRQHLLSATHNTLPSTLAVRYMQHSTTPSVTRQSISCYPLALHFIMLTARLEVTSLFQSVVDILRIFYLLFLLEGSGISSSLTTEVPRVVTLPGAVALLHYYVHMSLIHRDREGQLRTTYLEGL